MRARRRRSARLAAGAALVALAASLAACTGANGGTDEAAPTPAEPAPAEPAPAPAPPAPAGPGQLASEPLPVDLAGAAQGARIIQTATISVSVEKGRFDATVDRARAIAITAGGFVTASNAEQGSDRRLVRGALTARVPQARYAEVMRELSGLGRVDGRQEEGQDVSQQFVDLRARERHLAAVEARLLAFLDDTTTIAEALTVQERVNDVQLQLEQIRGQLRYLDDQTSYATIAIRVAERGVVPVDAPGADDGWGLRDAWHTAVDGIEKVVGAAFVAVVWVAPIAAGLLVVWLAWRAIVRRRRAEAPPPAAPTAAP